MTATRTTCSDEPRLYSVLWLFNGREEWEDYCGTRAGLRRWIRSTLEQELADCVIRIEEGDQ